MTISPTQDDVLDALRAFILAALPGVNAYVGVENRVPEPSEPDFAVMTPTGFKRLRTNKTTYQDVRFTGSIAPQSVAMTGSIDPAPAQPNVMPSGVLTVTAASALIAVGADVSGAGVTPTRITAQLTGAPGGLGTYAVDVAQEVLSEDMTASWGAMTVTAVSFGAILAGASLFGVGLAAGSAVRVAAPGGGAGAYVVSPSQTFASGTLASGATVREQGAQITVQVDFHSGGGNGADMAQIFSTLFRSDYAADFFSALDPAIAPLYADDPRYAPFQNENQQYEYRWIAEVQLQVNQTVATPQQFADSLSVTLVDVDAAYPP